MAHDNRDGRRGNPPVIRLWSAHIDQQQPGDKNRYCSFQCIKEQRDKSGSLPRATRHIRRARGARSGFSNICSARRANDQIAKRYRAQEICDQDG
jgi:hypothetical protein